jgi:hypothetical protein
MLRTPSVTTAPTKKRKRQPVRQLNALNPLDAARLFWWLCYEPARIDDHRVKYGERAHHATGSILAAILTWTPLLTIAAVMFYRAHNIPHGYWVQTDIIAATYLWGFPLPLAVLIPAVSMTFYTLLADRLNLMQWKEFGAGGLLYGGIIIMAGLVSILGGLFLTFVVLSTYASVFSETAITLSLIVGGLTMSSVVAAIVAFTLAGTTAGLVAFGVSGVIPANVALMVHRSAEHAIEYRTPTAFTRGLLPLWVLSNVTIAFVALFVSYIPINFLGVMF